MNLDIRDAELSDQSVIAEFNLRLAEETEDHQLNPSIINSGVAAVLKDSSKGRYWIATIDRQAVGQMLVTYEWSDWRDGVFWWIGSVYVRAEHRRKGVFKSLYQHVETLAKEDQNACGLRLYFEENNSRAKQTYLSLGMKKPGYLVMESIFEKNSFEKGP